MTHNIKNLRKKKKKTIASMSMCVLIILFLDYWVKYEEVNRDSCIVST
jgi:hypothetical protein